MKLLLDENLSRRIVPFLQAVYPGSSQVVLEALEQADDLEIWEYAKKNEFVIVTKGSDFHELSLLRGSPPKPEDFESSKCSERWPRTACV